MMAGAEDEEEGGEGGGGAAGLAQALMGMEAGEGNPLNFMRFHPQFDEVRFFLPYTVSCFISFSKQLSRVLFCLCRGRPNMSMI